MSALWEVTDVADAVFVFVDVEPGLEDVVDRVWAVSIGVDVTAAFVVDDGTVAVDVAAVFVVDDSVFVVGIEA